MRSDHQRCSVDDGDYMRILGVLLTIIGAALLVFLYLEKGGRK